MQSQTTCTIIVRNTCCTRSSHLLDPTLYIDAPKYLLLVESLKQQAHISCHMLVHEYNRCKSTGKGVATPAQFMFDSQINNLVYANQVMYGRITTLKTFCENHLILLHNDDYISCID